MQNATKRPVDATPAEETGPSDLARTAEYSDGFGEAISDGVTSSGRRDDALDAAS